MNKRPIFLLRFPQDWGLGGLFRTYYTHSKDKRYYSVAYAKAHGMHDKGGDLLIVVPMSSLPKEAKMSRAMHGKM